MITILNDRNWVNKMVHLALLRDVYNGKVPVIFQGTHYEYVGMPLLRMSEAGYIRIIQNKKEEFIFELGSEATRDLQSAVKILDGAEALNVFSAFNPQRSLITKQMIEEGLKGEIETPDGVNVADYLFDPRFVPTQTSLDLRIALITWKNEQLTQKKLLHVDPFTVVFLQKLVDERLQRDDLIFGEIFYSAELYQKLRRLLKALINGKAPELVEKKPVR